MTAPAVRPGNRLLLVHGFGGDRADFTDWLPSLAGLGWDAVAVQLPGHGGVDLAASYGLDAFADFVLAQADELGWDQFVLLGHSMGGMVAQLAALRAPHRIEGLVLMGTGHGPVDVDPDMVEAGKSIVQAGGMAALVEAQRGQPDTPAHERVVRQRPGYAEFMEAKALAMDPAMWLRLIDDMTTQDDRLAALASLALPTLVVAGEQDDRFLEPCRRLAAAIPGAALVVIADAGHSPQFEAPEQWWAAVSEFLASLPPPLPAPAG
jgi:pimeloyl-ACP methyl ester carboxylesterase